jgi:Lsr2
MRMAQRTELVDDLDKTSKADHTVRFGLDGIEYEIDLSEAHAGQLATMLSPYLDAGRPAAPVTRNGRKRSSGGGSGTNRRRSQAIRAWAAEQGLEVGDRGRIPASVTEAYDAANPA